MYYICFVVLNTRLRPAYSLKDTYKQSHAADVPIRMISLLHAIYTALYGLGYILGICTVAEILETRIISTAFLIFDIVQNLTHYKREGEASSLPHPYGVAFHHVVTLFFIYGIGFDYQISGAVAFFLGEIPVCFLNMTWLQNYSGNSHSRLCSIMSIMTLWTYFVCRLIFFPLIFFTNILPHMHLLSIFFLPSFMALIGVYLLNCFWFLKLIQRSQRENAFSRYFGIFSDVRCS